MKSHPISQSILKLISTLIAKFILLQLIILAGFSAFKLGSSCQAEANDNNVAKFRIFKDKTSKLHFLPPPLHHFNVEAPNSVTLRGAEEEDPIRLKTEVSRDSKSTMIAKIPERSFLRSPIIDATLYICDERKTYCLKQNQKVQLTDVKPLLSPKTSASVNPPNYKQEDKMQNQETQGLPGAFIWNDSKNAFQLAASQNKPVLISFFGIWCPPCNHLEANVFEKSEFISELSSKYVLLKMDFDQGATAPFKGKYKIKSIPTTVFTTSDGEEIGRIVGSVPMSEMLKQAHQHFQKKDEGFMKLTQMADASKDLSIRFRAAKAAFGKEEYNLVLRWLEPLESALESQKEPALKILYYSRVKKFLREEKGEQANQAFTHWQTILTEPSIEAFEALETLAGWDDKKNNSAAKTEKYAKALRMGESLLKTDEKEILALGYSFGDLHQMMAGIYDELNQKEKSQQSFLKCAQAFEVQGKSEAKEFARGPSLEVAYCLAKSGRLQESEKIYLQGIQRFPKETTYYYYYARSLIDDHKRLKDSLIQLERAVEYSYGDQKPKAIFLKAKALELLGEPKKGAELIKSEIERMKMAADGVHSPRLMAMFEKKLTEMNKQK